MGRKTVAMVRMMSTMLMGRAKIFQPPISLARQKFFSAVPVLFVDLLFYLFFYLEAERRRIRHTTRQCAKELYISIQVICQQKIAVSGPARFPHVARTGALLCAGFQN